MKLTIEHLEGYLSHRLKIQWHNGDIGYLRGIDQFRKNEYFKDGVSAQVTSDEENDDNDVFPANLVQIKPILHPLSDLTKEIEHNGEKFVPIERLRLEFKKIDGSHRHFDYPLTLDGKFCGRLSLPYWVTQMILEWHFDIHDLINNNLAVNYNDIK